MGLSKLRNAVINDPVAHEEYKKLKKENALFEMLQKMRINAGLTQDIVAQRMGTRPSHISRLENGRTNPSLETLRNYAHACNCELEFSYHPRNL